MEPQSGKIGKATHGGVQFKPMFGTKKARID